MSQIELKVIASTPAEAVAQLQALVQAFTGGTAAAAVTTGGSAAASDVAETKAATVTTEAEKPARATRTRRSAAPKTEPVVAEETKNTAEETQKTELTYDKDVRPVLVKLSSHKDGGREAAKEIVSSYKVKNGQDIPADKLAEAKAKAEAALTKLESAAATEDDDVEF